MKKSFLIILFLLLQFSTSHVFANSSYVLPYPGAMPGKFIYKPKLIFEKLEAYWYFGDFAKFDYNLKESDHYLVESKTLFEYGQYLLAYSALKKSDAYFMKVNPSLKSAKTHGKDISEKKLTYDIASEKHIEVLRQLKTQLPLVYHWDPEKVAPTDLKIGDALDESIRIRSKE